MAHAQASDSIPVAVDSPKGDSQLHHADPQAAGGEFEYKSPGMALSLSLLSTLVPMVAGTIMVSQAHKLQTSLGRTGVEYAGVAGLALGLSFGPSIGYAYSGAHFRGWGMGLLRLAGIGAGAFAIYAGVALSICGEGEDCSNREDGGGLIVLGAVSLIALAVSAVYDIATAPRAARRANEQHGLTNLSLVPVPIPGRSSTSPGLALVGQF